jgi:hypothetical protein
VIPGKLSYERSLHFYVNITRLYTWIPPVIQDAGVRILVTTLRHSESPKPRRLVSHFSERLETSGIKVSKGLE